MNGPLKDLIANFESLMTNGRQDLKSLDTFDSLMAKARQDLKAVCPHKKCIPEFNAKKARTMSVDEVRRKFPRFWGECPDCGSQVISYASAEHFIAGDW